jgi:signal transduction histidine kinase
VAAGVEISVESRGPIIPTDERDRIFEKGYRGVAATKMASSGSGMGLYIAETIAEAHRVKIQYAARNIQGDVGSNVFFFKIN